MPRGSGFRNNVGFCVKVYLLIALPVTTIMQIVGMAKSSWACRQNENETCIFEKLFETCSHGVCVEKVRYNGLAILAFTSFFINVVCCLTSVVFIWRSCTSENDVERAMVKVFLKWTKIWKWIAVMSFISNVLSTLLFLLGAWLYDEISSLIVFSLCSLVVTSAFLLVFVITMFYSAYHFAEMF